MKIYDHSHFFDGATTAIQTIDGGYISGGNSFDYFSNEDSYYIVKTNHCGDTLWSYYNDPSPYGADFCYSILQLQDSSFSICGWYADTVENMRTTFLLRLTKNGEKIWFKPVNAGFNDITKKHYQTKDKGFVLGGFFSDTLVTYSTLYIIKTDSLANIEWQKNYTGLDTGIYWLRNFEKTLDHGYILSGDFDYNSAGNKTLFLLKTDSLGNFEWIKYYGAAGFQVGGGFSIVTPDGGYAIVGAKRLDSNTEYAWVIKTDSAGVIQWEKNYFNQGVVNYFQVVRVLPDGSFVVGGGTGDLNFPNHNPRVWLLKLNSQGDSLWSKKFTYYGKSHQYGDITHDYLEDLTLTNDGGFLISGYVINNLIPTKNDLLLIKTDSLGNTCEIDTTTFTGCSLITSLVKIPDYSKFETQIYPNPANNILNINIGSANKAEVFIFDIQGSQLLHKNIYQNNTSLNIQYFPQGVYFVKVVSEAGTSVRKLIKE